MEYGKRVDCTGSDEEKARGRCLMDTLFERASDDIVGLGSDGNAVMQELTSGWFIRVGVFVWKWVGDRLPEREVSKVFYGRCREMGFPKNVINGIDEKLVKQMLLAGRPSKVTAADPARWGSGHAR